jgi:hypothetical protein
MEDIMGNRVNVMNGRSEVEHRGDNDVEKRQTIKEARKRSKQASKQAVGVNELSWREDEERLQSVAFGARPH